MLDDESLLNDESRLPSLWLLGEELLLSELSLLSEESLDGSLWLLGEESLLVEDEESLLSEESEESLDGSLWLLGEESLLVDDEESLLSEESLDGSLLSEESDEEDEDEGMAGERKGWFRNSGEPHRARDHAKKAGGAAQSRP